MPHKFFSPLIAAPARPRTDEVCPHPAQPAELRDDAALGEVIEVQVL